MHKTLNRDLLESYMYVSVRSCLSCCSYAFSNQQIRSCSGPATVEGIE